MAMLAEPRRKQRIGPNPRGLFFTEDDQNRGRTMLQKLGWKDGSGLGLSNQGINAPIKPKVQQNSNGLGFDVKENPWVAHSDKYAEILQNLNSASEGGNASVVDRLELEKNSKSSKSRIHYQKFVRNKDLSKCSSKDWECIFGKSVDVIPSEKSNHKLEFEESEDIEESVTLKDKFVEGGSMVDYFKQKFEQKLKNAQAVNTISDSTQPKIEVDCESEKPLKKKKHKTPCAEEIEINAIEPVKKKKSKKVKIENKDNSEESFEKNEDVESSVCNTETVGDEKKKFKALCTEAIEIETTEPVKKKKSKKVRKENDCNPEESLEKKEDAESGVCNPEIVGDGKKKYTTEKSNHKLEFEKSEDTEESVTMKDKFVNGGSMVDYFKQKFEQKLKNAQAVNTISNSPQPKIEMDCESEKPLKKKKHKILCTEEIETNATEPVKKKKSKKVKIENENNSEECLDNNENVESSVSNSETVGDKNFNMTRGRKRNWDEEPVNTISNITQAKIEDDCESEKPLKKKKRKTLCTEGIEINTTEPVKKKKSKKVKIENEGDSEEFLETKEDAESSVCNAEIVEDEKKKHKTLCTEEIEISHTEPVKKKKSKKIKIENECNSEESLEKKEDAESKTVNTINDSTVPKIEVDCESEKPLKKKKHKKLCTEEIEIEATEPVKKKKSKKVKIENEDNSEEPMEKKEDAESSVCNAEIVGDENFDMMRGRKRIWDEETVKHIASKYVGSNVLCIPGYPI